ncbi:hypothetical protein V8B55DRAFT_1515228 [Mucor lusitanicus]|uniref:Protein Abitram n=2 Tax=Mucor circinelloides f. lusitanicus TaxID=29924 RepID=A0A168KWW9_MUCCL|nr:hypothetical protein FB192DRAFT_1313053 [Mucor lusitanicus]OAD02861.1 hypothetical protein MUCCIDRAFT_162467 [Mucor lusitanicus CBS 277.49]
MDAPADYDTKNYEKLTSNWNNDPTAFLSLYYSLFYKQSQDCTVYVRQAPSKVCVLGMSTYPPNLARIKMHTQLVSEKVKKDTILCDLLDASDQVIGHVRAEMDGKLLELNSRFATESLDTLLGGKHHMDIGFIAIILPKIEDTAVQLKEFTPEEEYNNTCPK